MSEHAPKDRLRDLDARLTRLKNENSSKAGPAARAKTSGYGMAFTIAADLVGGVAGGAAVGWLVDRWLGSAPWGLIAFFFLGAAAGMWNVYRTVRGYDMSFGFVSQARPTEKRGKTQTLAGARPEEEGGDHRGQSTPSVPGRANHPDPHRRP